MRTPAITDFTRTPLFDGFGAVELAELTALATPWTAAAGDVLFRQGDHGDRLLVLSSGRLDVTARPPSGTVTAIGSIAPGEIVGELALLTGGRRAAMVRATEDSAGVALSREAFELLRLQLRPVARTVVGRIGEVALRRLLASYAAIAEDLGAPHSNETTSAGVASDHQPAALDFTSNGVPDSYLAEIFFFHRFSEPEIAELRSGLRLLTAPRGARIDPNGALWIVLRGCVQTSVVGASGRQRVRLAGPGRCVGHIGVLDGISHPPQLDAVLRERAVLLEVPHQRAHELLARNAAAAQRFTAAFFDDVVRALLAADAHIAPALRSGR